MLQKINDTTLTAVWRDPTKTNPKLSIKICSNCINGVLPDDARNFAFCPYCGARMTMAEPKPAVAYEVPDHYDDGPTLDDAKDVMERGPHR